MTIVTKTNDSSQLIKKFFIKYISGDIDKTVFIKDLKLNLIDVIQQIIADTELRTTLLRGLLLFPDFRKYRDKGIVISTREDKFLLYKIKSSLSIEIIMKFVYYIIRLLPQKGISRLLNSNLANKLLKRVIGKQKSRNRKIIPYSLIEKRLVSMNEIKKKKLFVVKLDLRGILREIFKTGLTKKKGPGMVLEGLPGLFFWISVKGKISFRNARYMQLMKKSDKWIEFSIENTVKIIHIISKKQVLDYFNKKLLSIIDRLMKEYEI